MAAGAGHYHLTAIAAVITLIVLLILAPIESALERRIDGNNRTTLPRA
jgi:uncharacterized membrane protein YhiD involved in acid resistance